MTAVRSVRSTAYGAKLFAYVLGVVAVGGAMLGLGYSLAWPALPDAALGDAPIEQPATLATGAVLGLLGTYVLGAGLLGAVHKLVADSVATGIASAEAAGVVGTPADDGEDADREPQPEPKDPGDQLASDSRTSPADPPGQAAGPGTDSGGESTDVAASATAEAAGAPGESGASRSSAESDAASSPPIAPEGDSEPAPSAGADAGTSSLTDTGTTPGPDGTPGPDEETDAASGPEPDESADASTPPADLETEPVDVEPTDTVPVAGSRSQPGSGAGGVDDTGATDRPSDPATDPPEPSPEEIAFGSSAGGPDRESSRDVEGDTGSGDRTGDDVGSGDRTLTEREDWFEDGVDEESDTETTETERTDGFEPAGSTAPSDPLADPNETE